MRKEHTKWHTSSELFAQLGTWYLVQACKITRTWHSYQVLHVVGAYAHVNVKYSYTLHYMYVHDCTGRSSY